jgi:hypothetical protein
MWGHYCAPIVMATLRCDDSRPVTVCYRAGILTVVATPKPARLVACTVQPYRRPARSPLTMMVLVTATRFTTFGTPVDLHTAT